MAKLVTYFSCTGTTRMVAERIAKEIGADIAEIRPANAYSDEDLDYTNRRSRSSVECRDKACRPEMSQPIDVADYDTVFVGFPIWWYDAPNIVYTFLESADLAGKTVVPFATSGGSGFGDFEERLNACRGDVTWAKGKLLNRRDATTLGGWARSFL